MMHSLIFGEFPTKPGYISLNFCVLEMSRKENGMNALEVKVIKGILSGMICFGVAGIIAETQILSLDLRLRKVEKKADVTNEVVMELSKTVAETMRYFEKELRNEEDDKEDAE